LSLSFVFSVFRGFIRGNLFLPLIVHPHPNLSFIYFLLPPLAGGTKGGGFFQQRDFWGKSIFLRKRHPHPNPLPSRERGRKKESRERGFSSSFPKSSIGNLKVFKYCGPLINAFRGDNREKARSPQSNKGGTPLYNPPKDKTTE